MLDKIVSSLILLNQIAKRNGILIIGSSAKCIKKEGKDSQVMMAANWHHHLYHEPGLRGISEKEVGCVRLGGPNEA